MWGLTAVPPLPPYRQLTSGTDFDVALNAVGAHLSGPAPRIAVVLGSGLGALSAMVDDAIPIPYSKIPGFPQATVAGHRGELLVGRLGETPVIFQNGRFHLYEGHDPATVALPVRLFAELGARYLIVTNAAGGLSPRLRPPTLMMVADHVNFMWRNSLIGKQLAGECRWPDLWAAYDGELRTIAASVALECGIPLSEGVYAGVLGPSFETPAEVRMLRQMGCDAVGMSTVPEVITARACGMRVLGISSITNAGAGLSANSLSHEEVLEVGRRLSGDLGRLVRGVVGRIEN